MGLSQSQLLHALGWATLNSLWQMALLWCSYLVAKSLFNLSASQRYKLSITAIAVGFFWAIATFVIYFNTGTSYKLDLFQKALTAQLYLPVILSITSVTYLLLLFIPAYRLFLNWRYTQVLSKNGLQKIDIQYRLFVKKIALQIGIKKNVSVYISDLIKSPVTIGFLKPIILLPLASLNNLTLQQVEAVLLHELSHVRRFDYIINIFINIAHTLLYFNPFAKFFIRVAEEERENCCDQMVLQFGYDKVSYASALLTLEKTSSQVQFLAMCATGKKNLLARIEKIVGIEKRPVVSFNRVAGFMAALLCIFAIDSLLLTTKGKTHPLSLNNPVNPLYLFSLEEIVPPKETRTKNIQNPVVKGSKKKKESQSGDSEELMIMPYSSLLPEPEYNAYIHASVDEIDAALTQNEKLKIKKTVESTKKVLETYEWSQIEKSIADVLTNEEKIVVKEDYFKEISEINWANLEKNLKSEYERINWEKVNLELNNALLLAKLDSMIYFYERISEELEGASYKENATPQIRIKSSSLPLPDESTEIIEEKKKHLKRYLKALKNLRELDVIDL